MNCSVLFFLLKVVYFARIVSSLKNIFLPYIYGYPYTEGIGICFSWLSRHFFTLVCVHKVCSLYYTYQLEVAVILYANGLLM